MMTMNRRFKSYLRLTAAAAVLSLGSVGAHANAIFYSGPNTLTDADAENFIDVDGDGDFSTGDLVRGIISFTRIESTTYGTNTLAANNIEFTGLFQYEIAAVNDMGALGFQIVFGPDSDFATEVAGFANVPYTAAELAGTTIAMFKDDHTAPDLFNRNTCTVAVCEASAINGSFVTALGYTGDADELVTIGIPGLEFGVPSLDIATTIGTLASFPTSSPLRLALLQQSFVKNAPGYNFGEVDAAFATGVAGADGLIGFNGTTNLGAPDNSENAYQLFTLTQGQINYVPEPATLSLLALGLVGVGAAVRGKNAKAAA
jgi:hypothetical protein